MANDESAANGRELGGSRPRANPIEQTPAPTVREQKRSLDSSAHWQLRPKDKLGPFTIKQAIGRGGMGVVYEAVETTLDRRVALKVLPPAALMDDTQIRRFRNEAAAAAQLSHPHIVPVYSTGSDCGVHYYAMQLIDGRNLSQVVASIRDRISAKYPLQRNSAETLANAPTRALTSQKAPVNSVRRSGKGLGEAKGRRGSRQNRSSEPWRDADFAAFGSERPAVSSRSKWFKAIASLGRDAALAIAFAHDSGVVHRDLKPSNLLLDDRGKIWITDFGLAHLNSNPIGTATGEIVGTYRYMSPEQAAGRKFLMDHRTDIYSLGATLYELLALQPAFSSDDPTELLRNAAFDEPLSLRKINALIPVELETIVSKAMAKNPHERYVTAHDLAQDLERFCRDQPIAARPPTAGQRLRRWATKNPTWVGILAVAGVMTFLGSLGLAAVVTEQKRQVTMEKEQVTKQLDRSRGLQLLNAAQLQLPSSPSGALKLAIEGSKNVESLFEVNQTLQAIMEAMHELASWDVRSVASGGLDVSPDGSRVVSVASETTTADELTGSYPAIVTDIRDGSAVLRLDSGDRIAAAYYSPRGDRIATLSLGEPNGQVSLWDAATGRIVKSYTDVSLSTLRPDNFSTLQSHLVLPGAGNVAAVYDTNNAELVFTLRGHTSPVTDCVFDSQGRRIASCDALGEIRIWDAKLGQPLTTIRHPGNRPSSLLKFSHDDEYLVVSSAEPSGSHVYKLQGDDVQLQAFWQQPTIALSPTQNLSVCCWPADGSVIIRDIQSGQVVSELPLDEEIFRSNEEIRVSFSDEGYIAVGSGKRIGVYDPRAGTRLYSLLGHTDYIRGLAYSSSHHWLSSSADKTVRLWSPSSGRDKLKYRVNHDYRGSAMIAFSEDSSKVLFSSTLSQQSLLFDMDGNRLASVVPGESKARQLQGNSLLVADGNVAKLVEPETARLIEQIVIPATNIYSLTALPKLPRCLIVASDGHCYLWDQEQKDYSRLTPTGDALTTLDISSSEEYFAIGTMNGKCLVYNLLADSRPLEFQHPASVASACFLNERQLVTIDQLSTLRLWSLDDPLTPKEVVELGALKHDHCQASDDGLYLVTSHSAAISPIVCWDTRTWTEIARVEPTANCSLDVLPNSPSVLMASEVGLQAWDFLTGETTSFSEREVLDFSILRDQLFTIERADGAPSGWANSYRPSKQQRVLCRYDLTTGERLFERTDIPEPIHARLCTDADAARIIVPSSAYVAIVFDRSSQTQTRSLVHHGPISFAALTQDSRLLTASWDGRVGVQSNSGRSFEVALDEAIITASLHDSTLACGLNNGEIALINVARHVEVMRLLADDQAKPVTRVEFAADGQHLLACYDDGEIRYWRLLERDSVRIAEPSQASQVGQLIPGEKAALIWSRRSPSRAAIVDLGNERPVQQLPINTSIVSAATSRDGRLALAASNGRITCYHRARPSEPFSDYATLETGSLTPAIAFSPDGKWLATAAGHQLQVWDINDQTLLFQFEVSQTTSIQTAAISSIAHAWQPFSADGKWIAVQAGQAVEYRTLQPLAQAIEIAGNKLLDAPQP